MRVHRVVVVLPAPPASPWMRRNAAASVAVDAEHVAVEADRHGDLVVELAEEPANGQRALRLPADAVPGRRAGPAAAAVEGPACLAEREHEEARQERARSGGVDGVPVRQLAGEELLDVGRQHVQGGAEDEQVPSVAARGASHPRGRGGRAAAF
jgi:hypothetical protein